MPPDAATVDALAGLVHHEVVVEPGGDGCDRSPSALAALVRARAPLASAEVVDAVVERVRSSSAGLGPIDQLLTDPQVSEIMINGPGPVWVERGGQLLPTDVDVDHATIGIVIERIVAPLGLRVDRASPVVDARLADGSRVNVVVPPLAVDGPYVSIRRFAVRTIPLAELATRSVVALLEWAVAARLNIVVSGGTGAGKTTLLNALAGSVPASERVITVEDAAELRLPLRHVVRLEARPPNADGIGGASIRDLVRNALRMRPDRIVVGEVRGAEAFDMVQAMNTGHDGSLSTCHANSPADAMLRLESLILLADVGLPLAAVREQLASSVDLVVHVGRCPDGSRRVMAVAEVAGGGAAIDVRSIADTGGLRELPSRAPRAAGASAADSNWLVLP